MKKAFTLVELIVVIGIIATLTGVMLASFGGGTESARAAKCLSNMRNLAQAVIAFAADTSDGVYPCAGSYAVVRADVKGTYYQEHRGWISWLSTDDPYSARSSRGGKARSFRKCDNVTPFCSDREDAEFAITNGAIWRYANGNRTTYVCPLHQKRAMNYTKTIPLFSYAMNAYFGYDSSNGSDGIGDSRIWMSNGGLKADRRLLFAELPFGIEETEDANNGLEGGAAYSESATPLLDATLQYKASYNGKTYNSEWGGRAETIAFNHRVKRDYFAHVAFADGHTEKLIYPKASGGLTLAQLTALLCAGVDVGFNGKSYQMQTDGDK